MVIFDSGLLFWATLYFYPSHTRIQIDLFHEIRIHFFSNPINKTTEKQTYQLTILVPVSLF